MPKTYILTISSNIFNLHEILTIEQIPILHCIMICLILSTIVQVLFYHLVVTSRGRTLQRFGRWCWPFWGADGIFIFLFTRTNRGCLRRGQIFTFFSTWWYRWRWATWVFRWSLGQRIQWWNFFLQLRLFLNRQLCNLTFYLYKIANPTLKWNIFINFPLW